MLWNAYETHDVVSFKTMFLRCPFKTQFLTSNLINASSQYYIEQFIVVL